MNELTLNLMALLLKLKNDERGDLFSQSLILVLVTIVIAGALLQWQTGFFTWLGTIIQNQVQQLIAP